MNSIRQRDIAITCQITNVTLCQICSPVRENELACVVKWDREKKRNKGEHAITSRLIAGDVLKKSRAGAINGHSRDLFLPRDSNVCFFHPRQHNVNKTTLFFFQWALFCNGLYLQMLESLIMIAFPGWALPLGIPYEFEHFLWLIALFPSFLSIVVIHRNGNCRILLLIHIVFRIASFHRFFHRGSFLHLFHRQFSTPEASPF